ncbi:hypothetical protein ALP75_203923 [Pseudomonas syringae pv. actinidiae]|nr:hypothetical protein ALP75_203923 [Pseudomonas syringae pv. actinidiae]
MQARDGLSAVAGKPSQNAGCNLIDIFTPLAQ